MSQLSGTGGRWYCAGGGPGGGLGGGVPPLIDRVRLCICWAFLKASSSCWSRKLSYSFTGFLPSGSRLAGDGEWKRSVSTELVLLE